MWIPVSSEASAQAVAQAIWDVRRPAHVRAPGDTTVAAGVVVDHPDTGEVRMQLPMDQYRVHAEAEATAMDVVLLPLIDADMVSTAEADRIRAAIVDNRGSTVLPEELLPQYHIDNALTDQEMAAAGFWE